MLDTQTFFNDCFKIDPFDFLNSKGFTTTKIQNLNKGDKVIPYHMYHCKEGYLSLKDILTVNKINDKSVVFDKDGQELRVKKKTKFKTLIGEIYTGRIPEFWILHKEHRTINFTK